MKLTRDERLLSELLDVVGKLRRRCPWDRKQTVESTRPLMLNETYELDEALRRSDNEQIVEELGDYLFMAFFLADVLRKERGVRLAQSLRLVIEKLKRRHPHIYGEVKVRGAADVLRNWDEIKRQEKSRSVLASVPTALPALQQAQLIQERCRRVGFDWDDPQQVLDKVTEEIGELRAELSRHRRNRQRVREELGDLFFALVNLARHLGVDAEGTLKDANDKFRQRFRKVEEQFAAEGRRLTDVTLAEMEAGWQQAKQGRRASGGQIGRS